MVIFLLLLLLGFVVRLGVFLKWLILFFLRFFLEFKEELFDLVVIFECLIGDFIDVVWFILFFNVFV